MNVLRQRLDELALTYHGEILDAVARALDTEPAFQWRAQSRAPQQTAGPPARAGAGRDAQRAANEAAESDTRPDTRRARLAFGADAIARRVAFAGKRWRASDLVAARPGRRPRTSTVHQTPEDRARMRRSLQAIRARLHRHGHTPFVALSTGASPISRTAFRRQAVHLAPACRAAARLGVAPPEGPLAPPALRRGVAWARCGRWSRLGVW
jgi:hypothetical protein